MALMATVLPTLFLLIAVSTASARFIAPEMFEEAQREMYDPYGQTGEQELDAPAAEAQQIRMQQISSEVQEYEEPLMSEIQGRCKNYHGYLVGNVRIAGSVCASTSRNGCARIIAGRRGLIRSFELCHLNGGRTLCYKLGSGKICGNARPWRSYPIDIPVPGRSVRAFVDIVDNDLCFAVPAYRCL